MAILTWATYGVGFGGPGALLGGETLIGGNGLRGVADAAGDALAAGAASAAGEAFAVGDGLGEAVAACPSIFVVSPATTCHAPLRRTNVSTKR